MGKITSEGLRVEPTSSGARVFVLAAAAARRAQAAPLAPGGPGPVEIDLQPQIDRLHAVKTELELSYWDHPEGGAERDAERYQIMFWILQIACRAAALEGILMHKGVARVWVRPAGGRQVKEIADARRLLETGIPEGRPFEAMRCQVAVILRAADTISLAAAGGLPVRQPPAV